MGSAHHRSSWNGPYEHNRRAKGLMTLRSTQETYWKWHPLYDHYSYSYSQLSINMELLLWRMMHPQSSWFWSTIMVIFLTPIKKWSTTHLSFSIHHLRKYLVICTTWKLLIAFINDFTAALFIIVNNFTHVRVKIYNFVHNYSYTEWKIITYFFKRRYHSYYCMLFYVRKCKQFHLSTLF